MTGVGTGIDLRACVEKEFDLIVFTAMRGEVKRRAAVGPGIVYVSPSGEE